ncbi:MAG: DNA topoisomerase IV subunit A [Acidobacteriota bacterium]|jgi:topoisomerase-4 subunit A|nr:DNA topoisomerase IV subunit A [Acidobacteriota bacterium]
MSDEPKNLSLFDDLGAPSPDAGGAPVGASSPGAAGGAGGGRGHALAAAGDGPLQRLIDQNFLQYAAYVIRDRAIPDLDDGLKPVQRRILWSLHENDDGKFIKVANIVGYCMQFHPHGDASIGDALVALANRRYFIDRQGNFGNLITGDPAAAPRYIECRLTEMGRTELFNDELTEFVPSYDGRKKEPVTLPAKIPVLLMLGAEGIAVGISTRILPHNFAELVEAQIAILKRQPFQVVPDFPQGGLMDARAYAGGRGHVLVRALVEQKDEQTLVVREIPVGTTTDSLIASVEDAAKRGKVKVKNIQDFTAERPEIEIHLQPEEDLKRAEEALYAFTQCQVQVSSRIVVIRDGKPVEMDVAAILRHNTSRLVNLLRRELQRRRRKLTEEMHHKTLMRVFVEERIYKGLETAASPEEARRAVAEGLQPFRPEFQRDVTHEDVESLLGVPIRRISLFDVEKNRREIGQLVAELEETERDLSELTPYAIRYLRGLLRKYGDDCPRRTRTAAFGEISERELTAGELTVGYDREKGYLGHKVAGEALAICSPLDRLLLVWRDGRCKITAPPDKLFVDATLIHCAVIDREQVVTVVYESDFFSYFKKFKIGGLMVGREARLAPKGANIRLLSFDDPKELFVRYVADGRVKIRQQRFAVAKQPVEARDAKGQVLTANKIDYVGVERAEDWDDALDGPPGKFLKV